MLTNFEKKAYPFAYFRKHSQSHTLSLECVSLKYGLVCFAQIGSRYGPWFSSLLIVDFDQQIIAFLRRYNKVINILSSDENKQARCRDQFI